jgi:hypothetical protein
MKSTLKNTRLPFAPTDALPGSEEKVHVLARRARLHQPLWHPLDATLTGARSGSWPAELAGDTVRAEEVQTGLCLAS